jgi:hypothetical protein
VFRSSPENRDPHARKRLVLRLNRCAEKLPGEREIAASDGSHTVIGGNKMSFRSVEQLSVGALMIALSLAGCGMENGNSEGGPDRSGETAVAGLGQALATITTYVDSVDIGDSVTTDEGLIHWQSLDTSEGSSTLRITNWSDYTHLIIESTVSITCQFTKLPRQRTVTESIQDVPVQAGEQVVVKAWCDETEISLNARSSTHSDWLN